MYTVVPFSVLLLQQTIRTNFAHNRFTPTLARLWSVYNYKLQGDTARCSRTDNNWQVTTINDKNDMELLSYNQVYQPAANTERTVRYIFERIPYALITTNDVLVNSVSYKSKHDWEQRFNRVESSININRHMMCYELICKYF